MVLCYADARDIGEAMYLTAIYFEAAESPRMGRFHVIGSNWRYCDSWVKVCIIRDYARKNFGIDFRLEHVNAISEYVDERFSTHIDMYMYGCVGEKAKQLWLSRKRALRALIEFEVSKYACEKCSDSRVSDSRVSD